MYTNCWYDVNVIRWNTAKDKWFGTARGISFQQFSDKIVAGKYIDILENPFRKGQQIFVLTIKNYTWVFPFILEKDNTIFLKTAYPSRKLHKLYGGSHEKED